MDLSGMMGKIKEMQQNLSQAKENIGKVIATGEAGGGMVKVTVNGNRQVLKIEIEDEVMSDKQILGGLLVSAINQAMKEVEEKTAAEMKNATAGVIPNIPGFDLNNLFK